ncbi:hypothetical protein DACRYDRAFT_119911 [Dacryopinax primogenitus]|uniref:Uncharacterized protein n=1 Tax=Dacryopinax primogenitus (strain DJM 731) TaxID=1858805 RepID=M5FP09_DACPD|nr:uncharacterized protein DACRYDRAFT_119911 [Dacryopinax primogenitus]EJT96693.1 hypothetical protein DACRYDRAFT_119911 [Dacryopinax primogenitus]
MAPVASRLPPGAYDQHLAAMKQRQSSATPQSQSTLRPGTPGLPGGNQPDSFKDQWEKYSQAEQNRKKRLEQAWEAYEAQKRARSLPKDAPPQAPERPSVPVFGSSGSKGTSTLEQEKFAQQRKDDEDRIQREVQRRFDAYTARLVQERHSLRADPGWPAHPRSASVAPGASPSMKSAFHNPQSSAYPQSRPFPPKTPLPTPTHLRSPPPSRPLSSAYQPTPRSQRVDVNPFTSPDTPPSSPENLPPNQAHRYWTPYTGPRDAPYPDLTSPRTTSNEHEFPSSETLPYPPRVPHPTPAYSKKHAKLYTGPDRPPSPVQRDDRPASARADAQASDADAKAKGREEETEQAKDSRRKREDWMLQQQAWMRQQEQWMRQQGDWMRQQEIWMRQHQQPQQGYGSNPGVSPRQSWGQTTPPPRSPPFEKSPWAD